MIAAMAAQAAAQDVIRELRAEVEQLRNTLTLESQYRAGAVAEATRLRATLLNIQSFAESGFEINHARLATQCRHALGDQQSAAPSKEG